MCTCILFCWIKIVVVGSCKGQVKLIVVVASSVVKDRVDL